MILVVLGRGGNALAPARLSEGLPIQPAGEYHARRRPAEAREQRGECRFAAAGSAFEQQQIAAFNCDVASLQYGLAMALVLENDVLRPDHAAGRGRRLGRLADLTLLRASLEDRLQAAPGDPGRRAPRHPESEPFQGGGGEQDRTQRDGLLPKRRAAG